MTVNILHDFIIWIIVWTRLEELFMLPAQICHLRNDKQFAFDWLAVLVPRIRFDNSDDFI
jgi:hypothetical protein